jgi:hypothetical protein
LEFNDQRRTEEFYIFLQVHICVFKLNYNCTLLNANYNYLPQLDNTDFDTHGTVKCGCGCVEDSGVGVSQTVMSDEGTNYCPRHNHTVRDTPTPTRRQSSELIRVCISQLR